MPAFVTWSLVGLALVALAFGFYVEGREGRFARLSRYGWVIQLAAVAFAYVVLRPGRGDAQALGAHVAAGDPVFLDFYSNY